MKGIRRLKNKFIARISIEGKRIGKSFLTFEDVTEWLEYMRNKHASENLENEIWMSIPEFSKYQCSNLGRIRSINYKETGIIKVLTPAINNGYLCTMLLNDENKYKTVKVHKLIAITFLGNKKPLEINHKNGIKTDNRIENIEWCTHSENCQHSFDIGLQKPKRGELNGMAKLTQKQVDLIREMKKSGGRFWGRNKIAQDFGISSKHLQKIANSNLAW